MTIEYQRDKQPLQQAAAMRGMTLVELMVVISIMAILAVMAFPSFNEMMANTRLSTTANSFVISAQLARSEAIKRNARVVLCKSADKVSCASSGDWEQGWIVFPDTNGSNSIDDAKEELIKYEPPLPTGYKFTGDAQEFKFESTGALSPASKSVLVMCPPSPKTPPRVITVSVTGRTSAKPDADAVCS